VSGRGRGDADGWLVALVALAARLTVVAWAAGRFPAVADGAYYHKLASRLAEGAGYTWPWPDGVVTYAAHYPVGYPAALSLLYRLTGPSVVAAGVLNALVGALGAWAVHELTRLALVSPRGAASGQRSPGALAAGACFALDPALVLYTPALMTEGVTAALLAATALLAALTADARGRRAWVLLAATGAMLGVCTLVRPQCLLVAPLFGLIAGGARLALPHRGGDVRGPPGWLARSPAFRRLTGAAAVTLCALAVCMPWTLRNCARMGRCALVSVNGGWNLLIGAAPNATGHWSPVEVPPGCKTVFDEAGKDACFAAAAGRMIAASPGRWLALVPSKLSATFDFCGAAPWYLHEANPAAFTERDKLAADALETGLHRLMLVAALLSFGLRAPLAARAFPADPAGPPDPLDPPCPAGAQTEAPALAWSRRILGGAGAILALTPARSVGFAAYLALAALALLQSRRPLGPPAMPWLAAASLLSTALVHAAFFGAGRYSMPVFPFVAACAGTLLTGQHRRGDT
jgi:hypothetical protein